MTKQEKIQSMKNLAISKGYEIKNQRTPAYDFISAVKGNVEIHIATLSRNECKISNIKEFENDLNSPQEHQYI